MAFKSPWHGVQAFRRRMDTMIGANLGGYDKKVLGYSPIAYWPLWETSGAVAQCLVNSAQNGDATGVTWANDATGLFGTPAPYFDGANDYVDVDTATLRAAWNAGGAEWSVMLWWKVANAGVWADGQWRRLYEFNDTAADNWQFVKSAGANTTIYYCAGGGTGHTHSEGGLGAETGWQCSVVTRSEAADEVKYYRNGNLLATDVVIGNWASAGGWQQMKLGAISAAPAQVWHGWLAHCAVWDRVLTQTEITALANP